MTCMNLHTKKDLTQVPFYKHLPMANSMVAGRILCLSSISVSILCVYLIYIVTYSSKGGDWFRKSQHYMIAVVIIAVILIDINPFMEEYNFHKIEDYKNMLSLDGIGRGYFEKGRFVAIGPFSSDVSYFPIMFGFASSEGFNIEGTVHNQLIWNHPIVNASKNYDYMAKNLAYFNIRYLLVSDSYSGVLGISNKELGLDLEYKGDSNNFYASNKPSSYFLIDKRNALILGPGSSGIAIEFPYLVHDDRENIYDYSMEELSRYKLIYISEPSVETKRKQEKTEAVIKDLVEMGIKIIIEPAYGKPGSLFGVTSSIFPLEKSPKLIKDGTLLLNNLGNEIEIDIKAEYAEVLFGLDKIYYKLLQNNGRLKNDVIGTKIVGDGEVVFVGMKLSHYLKAVYATNWGGEMLKTACPTCAEQIKQLYEDVFNHYDVQKDFWPESFAVEKANWHREGVDFEYSSHEGQEITVSLTYSPRWKASVDSNKMNVGQKENLVVLRLPAGHHKVELKYGITKYGVAGYMISLISFILLLVFLRFYDRIIQYSTKQIECLIKYIEL
jgi:hypothetical protein